MSDIELMKEALTLAEKAGDMGEVPVGAVVSLNGEIVGKGYNFREKGKNALYHAELMAINEACKNLGGWRLWQCDLHVSLEPCPMCVGAIINSRIKKLVYAAPDLKAGCCESVINLFELPFNHSPEIFSGILEEESKKLLKNFFAGLRQRKKGGYD